MNISPDNWKTKVVNVKLEKPPMKIDQIAFYARTKDQEERIKVLLGLDTEPWVEDVVTAKSLFPDGQWCINKGRLQFNYSLGIELEILTYIEGRHWHLASGDHYAMGAPVSYNQAGNPLWGIGREFISHVGIHLDDGADFPAMDGCTLVQETFTQSHTSEYLTTGGGAGRKYHYRIFELAPGTYIKYIRRIHPKGNSND